MWDLSSLTRDRTPASCIGRQSLNYWTGREVPLFYVLNHLCLSSFFPLCFLFSSLLFFNMATRTFKITEVKKKNYTGGLHHISFGWRWPRELSHSPQISIRGIC